MSKPCPICGKPAPAARYRPFCSQRCADIDLGRWFTGSYAIPGPPPELEEDEAPDRG
ncbi:MAG: DNA gyrase inhibitor YacG [Acetobacteraceae bacterium]|nr:DNA gyrase inhibitor YacG [Acetobacteraceae bacterium]